MTRFCTTDITQAELNYNNYRFKSPQGSGNESGLTGDPPLVLLDFVQGNIDLIEYRTPNLTLNVTMQQALGR